MDQTSEVSVRCAHRYSRKNATTKQLSNTPTPVDVENVYVSVATAKLANLTRSYSIDNIQTGIGNSYDCITNTSVTLLAIKEATNDLYNTLYTNEGSTAEQDCIEKATVILDDGKKRFLNCLLPCLIFRILDIYFMMRIRNILPRKSI